MPNKTAKYGPPTGGGISGPPVFDMGPPIDIQNGPPTQIMFGPPAP